MRVTSNEKRVTRCNIIFAPLVALLCLGLFTSGAQSQTAPAAQPAPTLEQAALYFALGSLDAAENEVRRFLAAYPDHARKNEAIQLLAEIKIEKERARIATTAPDVSGAKANVEPDRTPDATTPKVLDPSILSSPPSQVPLKWEKQFPGEPAQFRKDGLYAVTATGEGARTSIRILFSGPGDVSFKRTGSMILVEIAGATDAMPKGAIDLPAGGATRIRHVQASTEPLVARVSIDLKSTEVKATVTPAAEEIVIEVEDPSGISEPAAPAGGLYRAPVPADRARLDIIGGNFQRALVADALAEALAVKVVDRSTNAPIANATVEFSTVTEGMKLLEKTVVTGADGVATTHATLDRIAGRKVIAARLPGTPAEVSFEVYALPRPPDSIRKVSGEDAKVRTRQTVATPLVAVVQDVYGNPVPGVEVEWNYISGGGTVDADAEQIGNQSRMESDKDGRVTLRQWSTGPIAGVQRVQASFTSGEVTKFTQFELQVQPQLVSMDFYQTSVPEILRFLGRIANWNLILSDGVSKMIEADAMITVHLENVPIDDALDKILSTKKLARIEEPDGSIKIMTFAEAQTRGQAVITDPAQLDDLPQDMVRTVILNVSPRNDFAQTVGAIQPLMTENGKIVSDAASRKVVVTDYVSVIRRIRDILAEFEKAEDKRVLTFQNVNFASEELKAFVQQQLPPEVKTLFVGRTAVLLGPTSAIDRVEELLRELDLPENSAILDLAKSGQATTKVFALRFTEAAKLAPLLRELFSQSELQVGLAGGAQTTATPVRGGTEVRPQGAGAPAAPNAPAQPAAVANAERVLAAAERTVARATTTTQKIFVVADDRTNKLIVTSPQEMMPSIVAVVAELDTVVPLRPLVLTTAGIDPAFLQSTLTTLYPGYKFFFEQKLGKAVLFVPPDFDAKPIRALMESLSDTSTGGDTVVIRKLRFANAAALTAVLKNLQAEAATTAGQRATRTTQVAYDEMGEPVLVPQTPAGGAAPAAGTPAARPEPSLSGITGAKISQLKIVPVDWVNTLILIGPSEVVASINKVIDEIDRKEGTWEIVPVKNADAVNIAPVLQQIFPTSRIFAEPSSNSLILVVNSIGELPEIKKALDFIDQSRGTRVDDTTIVHQLKRANVTEVTNILLQIFSNAALNRAALTVGTGGNAGIANDVLNYLREQDRKADRQNLLRLFPVISKNLIVIQAPAALAAQALHVMDEIEAADPYSDPTAGKYVQVYFFKYLLPSQFQTVLAQTLDEISYVGFDATHSSAFAERHSVKSIADDALRSLIVYAATNDHVQIKDMIKEFDVDSFAVRQQLVFYKIQIKNTSATLVGKWLRDNMLNKEAHTDEMIFVSAGDSKIVLWTYAATQERINRVLPMLDLPEFNFSNYRIFKQTAVPPAGLSSMITTLYTGLKVAVIPEAKSVIVFADQAVLDEIDFLIRKMSSSMKFVSYPMRHASPRNVAMILDKLVLNRNVQATVGAAAAAQAGAAGTTGGGGGATATNELTEFYRISDKSINVWALPSTHERIEDLLPSLDVENLPFDALGSNEFDSYAFEFLPTSGISGAGAGGAGGGIDLITRLQSLVPGGYVVIWHNQENYVLLWGRRADIERALDFCRTIDRTFREQRNRSLYRFVDIKNRPAAQLRDQLVQIWEMSALDITAQVLPNAEMNQLLFFFPSQDLMNKVLATVAQLDTVAPTAVLKPKNQLAATLQTSLATLYPDVRLTPFTGAQNAEIILAQGSQKRLDDLTVTFNELDVDGIVFDSYVFRWIPINLWWDGMGVEGAFPGLRLVHSTSNHSGNFILMWGRSGDVKRAKDYVMKIDEAARDHVGGETLVRTIDIKNRPAQEVFQELNLIWGASAYIQVLSLPQDPRNAIVLFLPPDRLKQVAATIEQLDTVIPTRIFYGQYLYLQPDLQTLRTNLFPDVSLVFTYGATFYPHDMAIARGPKIRLDDMYRIWTLMDTAGYTTYYQMKYMAAADIQAALTTTITHISVQPVVSATAGAQYLVISGDRWRVQDALNLLKSLDVDGIEFESYTFQWVSTPQIAGNGGGVDLIRDLGAIVVGGRVVVSTAVTSGNFVLMWGRRGDLNRALDYCHHLDDALRNNVGGETHVRIVEVSNRPAQAVFDELSRIWGLSSNMAVFASAQAAAGATGRNAIILFMPPNLLDRVEKTIHDLDTTLPIRIFRSSYLHTQTDLNAIITGLFPDIRIIPAGIGSSAGYEQVIARGSTARLDELARLWTTLDTPERIVPYWPVNRPSASLLLSLRELMPHIGAIVAANGGAGNAPDVIMLHGDPQRVDEAVDFLKKIDVAGEVRLLKFGRLPAVDAQSLVAAFYPGVRLTALSNGSILAAGGNAQVLEAAEKLLADVEDGLQWRIMPLSRMTAAQASALVTSLFGNVRVTQLPAGNGVVLLGTDVGLAEAIDMIKKVDQREISLIKIKEADFATVATAVTTFFPEAQIQQLATVSSLAVSADSTVLAAIEKFVTDIDKARHTAIRPLKYYDPTTAGELGQLTTTLQSYLSANGTIFFDRQSNSFVMSDAMDKLEKALKVLDDLDRSPPQFIIEAVIAEVAITDAKNLGFTWSYRPDLTALSLAPPARLAIPAAGGSSADFASSGTFSLGIARENLQATLSALLSRNDARIVATPKIVTRNNVAGSVNLQQSFPFTTTTPATATTGPTVVTNFQLVPTTLTVTPSSSWNSDAIRMAVVADISVPGAPTATGAVPVSSRIVNTTVDMKDGQTLIIGGLMQKNKTEAVAKIPILGDIPGLGNIFRNTTTGEENREVLIFLSPRVIYPQTHDLQMEEELNRYKYLVNFPVDWSGRRWLVNNPQRSPGLREQRNQGSNFIVTPPGSPAPSTPPPAAPVVPPAAGRSSMAPSYAPASAAAPAPPPSYIPPMVAPSSPMPAASTAPQPVSPPAFLGGVVTTYNINTATAADLKTIPDMPAHVAQLIVAYRNANGNFRSLDDLLNVPGMTPEILDRSRKYLRMTSEPTPVAPTPTAANAPTYTPPPVTMAPSAPAPGMVNINTAGVSELMSLPGVSEANARMILAYRNTYGTFSTTDQLIDVPGITPTQYGAIRDRVTVSNAAAAVPPPTMTTYTPPPSYAPSVSAGAVDINTADEQTLMSIGFSEQNAKLIVAWRNSYGAFKSIDDLLDVPSITQEILDRMRSRLTVGGGASMPTSTPQPSYAPAAALVNVNTADEQTLMALGFSDQNAKLIVAWRNSYGPFNSLDELLDVPSITPEILDRMRSKLTVK